MITVSASGLGYRVGSSNILDGIELTVEPGSLLALVGPNGAGKSTLVRALCGDIRPTSGDAFIDGVPVESLKPLELALLRSVLPQQFMLEFGFTAREVVEFGRYALTERGLSSPTVDRDAVDRALDQAGMASFGHRSFPTLSGGEQTRVMLARVLAQDTQIMFLDEPTASLDVRHQHHVMRIARQHANEGGIVIAVLHDLNLASWYADRIGILDRGRLRSLGSPDETLVADVLSDVYRYPIDVIEHPRSGARVIVASQQFHAAMEPELWEKVHIKPISHSERRKT